jgi:transcriptional regulator with XRE-family HTH domain
MGVSTFPVASQTVRLGVSSVNTILRMESRGSRLRRFLQLETGGEHGWVNRLATESGVTRQTLSAWMGDRAEPDMGSLTAVAAALGVPRYRLIAAMDGDAVLPLDETGQEQLGLMLDRLLEERGFQPPRARPGDAR